eukprot:scaffold46438_cov29-Tisochrysis_lutea.AAC.8
MTRPRPQHTCNEPSIRPVLWNISRACRGQTGAPARAGAPSPHRAAKFFRLANPCLHRAPPTRDGWVGHSQTVANAHGCPPKWGQR